ncbi:peptide deformylase [Geosporobacter ferrireducens]|uniref:Peptide deformylase n=1 Tax=Geosporobacter ferrireducens TaxID=1424294 RepID=A0A1D8GBY1_9FIRM|nr:peptide deformylase [Geosporobacter ferrireducens]AOT68417.1 peptide deformylase [Geosporobacter ferrireducens]MTI53872.1 peptide deformylase [Geosporobacter ferrireducens]
MAIRNILKDSDPTLRKKSRIVEKIDDRILVLLDDMIDTMYEADGVGLAAPQVGVLKRIIVVDVGEGIIELINPEIIDSWGEQVGAEGCLSLPGITGDVSRPAGVRVKGLNRKGETIEIEGKDLLAVALCHEIDHLEGILFTDRVID